MIQVSRSPRSSLSTAFGHCRSIWSACSCSWRSADPFTTTGSILGGITSTAWPFLSGLAIGWGAVAARRLRGPSLYSGVVVCISTVAVGMVLRVVSGQGTAFAFVLVALGFLGSHDARLAACRRRLVRMRSRSPLEA